MKRRRVEEIVSCSIVKAEMFYGAMKSAHPVTNLSRLETFFAPYEILPFDDAAARRFGEIRASLEKQGTPIGPYDLQIAAVALANGCVVVTHNTREFSRVSGLLVEDWETA
jgi:tRNA(fMet)-specific endonuclease VapC